MSGRFLLDTNVIIAHFAAEPDIVQRLDAADDLFVPVIAIGELLYGASKSARAEENAARIREFAGAVSILPVTGDTAEQYGAIKNELRAKGRPIPENDIWIAALARQHDLTLVSRDQDHFREVPGLRLETW